MCCWKYCSSGNELTASTTSVSQSMPVPYLKCSPGLLRAVEQKVSSRRRCRAVLERKASSRQERHLDEIVLQECASVSELCDVRAR